MDQSLLTKTPSPEDSRAVILELTAAGKQLNDTLNQLSDQQLRQLLDPLSPAEQQQVFDAIETLNRLLLP
jgi:DNA-binding MarR family transcriptional regulator